MAGRVMQALASSLSAIANRIAPPLPVPTRKDSLGVYRDADGIWVPTGGTEYAIGGPFQPYAQHPVVYKAVTIIARNISSVALEFFKGDSDEPLPPTDPIPMLFAAPDVGVRGRNFIALHALDMELTGDWFVELTEFARPGKGLAEFPRALRRLHRSCMKPDVNKSTGELEAWLYETTGGQKRRIPVERIMHSMYTNPSSTLMGLAPLSAAMLEAESDHQAQLWNRFFFENDTSSGLVFQRDKDAYVDQEADRSFLEWWREKRSGVHRSHTPILPPPGTTIDQLGTTQSDMGFIDLRRMSREQILAVFDVPPAVAGVFEYANYANAREQLRYFWYHKLFPMMADLEGVIQADLLDRYQTGVRCAFKREDVQALIEDFGSKLDAATKLWSMGIPFEAINDRLDLGFDVDDIEGADVGYLPFSVQTVGEVNDPTPQPQPGQPPDNSAEQEKRAALINAADRRTKRWTSYMWAVRAAERDMYLSWVGFLNWATERAIRDLKASDQAAYLGLITHREQQILPDDAELEAEAKRRVRRSQASAYKSGRKTAEADIGASLDFNLLDIKVVKALQDRSVAIKSAAHTYRDAIRLRVQKGIEDGSPVQEIASSIESLLRENKKGMAITVARTETMAPFSKARLDAFGEAGVLRQEWLSARDADVRPSHQIDGEVQPLGSSFSNGLQYPHDPSGSAEETINCRCVVLPVEGARG